MSVQLIIDGNSVTDVIAQVNLLAEATGTGKTVVTAVTKAKDLPLPKNTELADNVDPESEVKPGGIVETKPKVAPKNLSTKEQKAAVTEMIEAGQKDDRYDRMNATNQKRVDTALAKAEEVADEPEQTDIEEAIEQKVEAENSVEVTLDTIREKMSQLGKDGDGNDNRDNLIAIRELLVKYIPEGEDVKISNIPEDQMVNFYESISELG
jgi:hypothetical protein